jgi:hypothetical protein
MCPLSSFIGILQVLQVMSRSSFQGSQLRFALFLLAAIRDKLEGQAHMTGTRLLKPWQQRSIKHCGVRQDLLNDVHISNRRFSTK